MFRPLKLACASLLLFMVAACSDVATAPAPAGTLSPSPAAISLGTTGPLVNPDNGHAYEFVAVSLTWHDAAAEAATRTHAGTTGHLVTITSAAENAFLVDNFTTSALAEFAWIGGHEPDDDGVWRWAFGDEAGIQFSLWASPTPPFNYANWGASEPNDHKFNEDYPMFNIGASFASIATGEWADAVPTPNPSDPVVGYFVEYPAASVLAVDIDIRPGGEPNSINMKGKGKGKVAVAILSSGSFDATQVDPATATLGDEDGDDTSVAERRNGTLFAGTEDVDGDGLEDLVLHFNSRDLIDNGDLTSATTSLVLLAELGDGTAIRGEDSVNVLH